MHAQARTVHYHQFHKRYVDLQRIFSKNKNSEFNYMHILKSQRMSAIPEMFYQGPWYELEYTLDLYLQT